MGILDYFFLLPGMIFLVSGLPQTYKLLKTRSAGDLSRTTYALTLTAIAIVCLDALVSKNWTILWSNGVSLMMVSVNFALILKFQKNANR